MKIVIFTIKEDAEIWRTIWEKLKKLESDCEVRYFLIDIDVVENSLSDVVGNPGDFLKINNKDISGFFFIKTDNNNKIKIAVIRQFGDALRERKEDNTIAVKFVIDNYAKEGETIYIVEHLTGGKIEHNEFIKGEKAYIGSFQHEVKGDIIYEVLEKFINSFNYKSFDELCDVIKKKPIISNFSLLKHRIAHLWLPMDIDLQGIMECWNIDRPKIEDGGLKFEDSNTKKYLEEVLSDKENKVKDQNENPAYYRQKLADLWYMVVKGKMEDGKKKIEDRRWKIDEVEKKIENGKEKMECIPVPPREKLDELLADKEDAITDLIEDKKKDEKVKEIWKTLLKICGLNYDENAPFNKKEMYPQSSIFKSQDSPILQFMCLLDCGIEDEKHRNVDKILNFQPLKEFIENLIQSSILNFQSSDLPFHSWFCALDECLEKLREKTR